MEEFIRGVLVDVLKTEEEIIKNLGVDDDLIKIGLDSLKAIELVVYIEDHYGITISDDDLLIDNISSINKIEEMIRKYF